MNMSRTKRFTKDEIDVLSKSPYVKNIRENRLSFTYDFRCILYDEWIKYPSVAQIRKALMLHNFNCTMIGCDVINRLHRNFKRDDLKGLCRECKYGDMCLGGCSNSRFTLNGTIESENILCSYNYKLVQARKYINKLDEEQLLQLFTILIEKNEYQIAKMVYDRIKNINGNHVIEMSEKYLQVNMDCKENNNE